MWLWNASVSRNNDTDTGLFTVTWLAMSMWLLEWFSWILLFVVQLISLSWQYFPRIALLFCKYFRFGFCGVYMISRHIKAPSFQKNATQLRETFPPRPSLPKLVHNALPTTPFLQIQLIVNGLPLTTPSSTVLFALPTTNCHTLTMADKAGGTSGQTNPRIKHA